MAVIARNVSACDDAPDDAPDDSPDGPGAWPVRLAGESSGAAVGSTSRNMAYCGAPQAGPTPLTQPPARGAAAAAADGATQSGGAAA